MSNSQPANIEGKGKNSSLATFIGRVTLVHVLTYSLVGALYFFWGSI